MKQQQRGGVLFYSCALSDSSLCEQLARALHPLVREAHLSEWAEHQLPGGTDVVQARQQGWRDATLVLLLLSPDYLASETCYQEMLDALERQQRGELRAIPIVLRPCDRSTPPLSTVHCLPSNGQAVTSWSNPEQAFFTITQSLRHTMGLPHMTLADHAQGEQRGRNKLLTRVRDFWIKGVLERSLHQEARLDLHLQDRPDALENPWQSEIQESQQEPRPFPEETTIIQVYDDSGGELLILGKAGAGKTTLLLELARTLLQRAELDVTHPLPVIFHLAFWARKQQPFAEWLIAELSGKYRVSPLLGKRWIENRQILLLLDGLDEVREEVRDSCVRAILDYQESKTAESLAPLVICCRSQNYAALSTRLRLNRAVEILPLTQGQIDQYLLKQAGSQLGTLQEALQRDTKLARLARRPLVLTLLPLALQHAKKEEFPTGETVEDILHTIFARYAEEMLKRRKSLKRWKREQAMHWLAFLAKSMQQEGQPLFSVENLQLDWLPKKQKAFYRWSARFVCILLGAVLGQFTFGFLGYWIGPLAGALCGILFAELNPQIPLEEPVAWLVMTTGKERITAIDSWGRFVIVGLGVGIAGWHQFGPFFVLQAGFFCGLLPLLSMILLVSLLAGLYHGLPLVFSQSHAQKYSYDPALRRDAVTRIFFVLVGICMGVLDGLLSHAGLLGILISGLVGGWLFGISFVLLALLEHVSLRFWLWRSNCLPWKLVPFLDEMTNRLLLHKVGERYIFVDRWLYDYFARQEVLTSSNPSQNNPISPK